MGYFLHKKAWRRVAKINNFGKMAAKIKKVILFQNNKAVKRLLSDKIMNLYCVYSKCV